jgi:hypothetical protein
MTTGLALVRVRPTRSAVDSPARQRSAVALSPIRRRKGSPSWARLAAVVGVIAAVTGACGVGNPPSVWVDNRSAEAATFFVDGLGPDAGPFYIVPPHTSAHVANPGLGWVDVRVNVLGWRHEEGHVGPCAPGNYDDAIYNVPARGSVRLLIDPSGQPSVSLAPEPPSLPDLNRAPLDGPLTEEQLCQRIQELLATPSPA